MKTRAEVEELKRDWLSGPCYDLYSVEGFEDHQQELMRFQEEQTERWNREYAEREERRRRSEYLARPWLSWIGSPVVCLPRNPEESAIRGLLLSTGSEFYGGWLLLDIGSKREQMVFTHALQSIEIDRAALARQESGAGGDGNANR